MNGPLVEIILGLIFASISCSAAVVSVYFASKPASSELQADVDQLAGVVEKVLKGQRKERMARVRHGEADASDQNNFGHPEGALPVTDKAVLRTIARQKGALR